MKTNSKFTKKIMGIPVFAGILFIGSFGLSNINNKNINNLVSNSETVFDSIDNLAKGKVKVKQLSMGDNHSAALTESGNVYTWGDNSFGQLGDDSKIKQKHYPTNITNNFFLDENEQITQISMGGNHSAAVTNKGSVFTWGHNGFGQLGDGTYTSQDAPIEITDQLTQPGGSTTPMQVKEISLGAHHSMALTDQGYIYTWGDDSFGQLGDGKGPTGSNSNTPIMILLNFNHTHPDSEIDMTDPDNPIIISPPDHIDHISAGDYHSSALYDSGSVYTWGYNTNGQLGNGKKVNKHSPINITDDFFYDRDGGERITQLSMGGHHSSALTNEGNVHTWGKNSLGQLGDGTIESEYIPRKITNKFNSSINEKIIQISMGEDHSAALSDDGNVYTWGHNLNGQLGIGLEEGSKKLPKNIMNKFNLEKDEQIMQISMGENHSAAVSDKGNVYTWGYNAYNQTARWDSLGTPGIVHQHSTVSFDGITNITTNSVKMNFTVYKNNQNDDGNVVIKDSNGTVQGRKNDVDGKDSIIIENLATNTTFTGWTIEVNGNGKKIIPDFKTNPILSNILFNSVTNKNSNSVTINFTVNKNDQNGNVVIRDRIGIEKGSKNDVDGKDSIIVNELDSDTTFTGWTIEVDGNDQETIPDFKTDAIMLVNLTDIEPINIKETSVEISFNLEIYNPSDLVEVTVWNNNDKIISETYTTAGNHSIKLDKLTSGTTYNNLSISVNNKSKQSIPEFKTKKHTSNGIDNKIDIEIQNKINIKNDTKEVLIIYSEKTSLPLDGTINHIIDYQNGGKQILTADSNQKMYYLHQPIENIVTIDTFYRIDSYSVWLNSHSGNKDRIFGNLNETTNKGSISFMNLLFVSMLGVITIALMIFIIYFFKKNNKLKTQNY